MRVELISGAAGAGVGIVAAETIEETTGNAWGGLVVAALGLWAGRQARGKAIKSFGGGMAIGAAGMTVANLVQEPVRQLITPLISGALPAPANGEGPSK